jgi:hypothetical protein
MNSSEIKNLTKALLKAQMQMGSAVKGSKNPFFKSNYADLPTVMEVVKGPLNDAGIIILQPASHKDGKNFITTTLIHAESGESISSETEVICAKANDAQAFGAAQTYARRFGLQAMLFIPAEDDDGNYASGRTTTQATNRTATAASAVTAASPVANVAPAGATSTPPAPMKTSSFRKKKDETSNTTASAPADEFGL